MILLKSIPKIDKFINNKAFDGFSKELITKISKKIIGFLPVKGFEEDMTALIGENTEPVVIVDLRPWK